MNLHKLKTYFTYFGEYLKNGDIGSITASVRYLMHKGSHANDRIIRSSIGKFYCRKNTNDFQFANYRYEWGVKKFLLDNIKDYTVFIDGGSCVGEYCVLLSKRGIRCYAFEPVKANYDVMCKNMELNGLKDKVQTFPFGLGDRNMQAPFYFNPVNTGASHIITNAIKPDIIVDIRTFDSCLDKLGLHPNDKIMVKLDVEKMEPEAIKGSMEFIRKYNFITFVIEEKHSGAARIRQTLLDIADFEFGIVDEYNIFARKKTSNTK
jgi:FkbM family methyltransferase